MRRNAWRMPVAMLIFMVVAYAGPALGVPATSPGFPAFEAGLETSPAESGPEFTPANDQGQYRYLIEFAQPGLLDTAHLRGSGQPFDANSPEAVAARAAIQAYQAERVQAIDTALGRSPEVSHHFLVTHNGLALWLDPQEVAVVSRLPEVVAVTREPQYELATYRGPWFIGADTIWNGSNTPNGSALRGEGMVLGVIDTGIDPEHPSFGNDPACNHGQGAVPNKVLSVLDCGSTDGSGLCNGSNPVDTHGHGTHVASTAAGNFLNQNAMPPPQPPGGSTEISGVAPCAHVRSYMACPGGSCPGSAIVAGLNNILLHGDVDVLNYSISGGNDPWNDGDRLKLDLVDAGVLAATAAGNTGTFTPNPVGQVNHRGPWVLSVAASSHDGAGTSAALLSVAGPGTPPDETTNIAATSGSDSPAGSVLVDFPIRHFGAQPAEFEGCTPGVDDGTGIVPPADMEPFPEDYFSGAAALIRRGSCTFTTKIANAFDAGAELVIIRNSEPGELNMSTPGQPDVPAYAIPEIAGNALQAFVNDHPDTATIDFDPIAGDVLGNFSLRGPTPPPLHNLTKPDITAPGVSIYAAVPQDVLPEGYGTLSGTSMASPHAAGSALLVRQAHPDWTVPEVISALMTTAKNPGRKENLVDAWDADDVGSGRVDLTRAARAGLVFHETFDNYLAADPDEGGDVRTLNLPALRDLDCRGSCTFTRTVRNTLDVPSQWTVAGNSPPPRAGEGQGGGIASGTMPFEITIEPETFTFTGDPGETQELTITVTPLENNLFTPINFGEVVFTETGGLAPDQRLTVAIRGRPPQPVLALDPNHLESEPETLAGETRTLTIVNPGEQPLDWTLTEQVDPSFITHHSSLITHHSSFVAGDGPIDCNNHPGLIIQDTGIVDGGLGAEPGFNQVMLVDRFTPDIVPADFTAVCLAFLLHPDANPSLEIEFEIVVLDDDGPDGRPGTELGALPVTASGFPSTLGAPVWRSFDISSLDISVGTGSVYIGARWEPRDFPDAWGLAVDYSPFNPPGFAGGWWWVGPQDVMFPIQEVWSEYRAMFVRPLVGLGPLDCTLPEWIEIDTASGTVTPGGQQALEVHFDPSGLEIGDYVASLCLETGDPDRPLAVVPLTLTVNDLDVIFTDNFEAGGAP